MDKETLSHEVVKQLHLCGHFLHFRMGCIGGRNRILAQLHIHGETLQKDLQERLRVQSGSLSELIIKMEVDGLIEKVRSPHDARNFLLRLTQEGLREAERCRAEHAAAAEQLMSCISQEDLTQLHEKLDILLKNWHESGQLKLPERRNHD